MNNDVDISNSFKLFFDSFGESLQVELNKYRGGCDQYLRHTVGVIIFAGSSMSYKYENLLSASSHMENGWNIPCVRGSVPEHKWRLDPILVIFGEVRIKALEG